MLGETVKGEAVTLTGAWISSSRAKGMTPFKHVISAERVLMDVHLEVESSPVFTSARVQIENLDIWSDLSRYTRTPDCADPTARVPTHDSVEFTFDDLRFRLRHMVDGFGYKLARGAVGIVCPTRVVLEVSSEEPLALNGFDEAVFSWVDMLSFWARETCALRSFRLIHKDHKVMRVPKIVKDTEGKSSLQASACEVDRVVEMRARWSKIPQVPPDTEFNLQGVAFSTRDRPHAEWYVDWMAFRNRAKRGLDMLLSLTYGNNTFLQSDLLVVALGAETLHRDLHPDCLAMQPRDFERMLSVATRGLEQDDRARIERSIKNEPSYSDRLRDLTAIPAAAAVNLAVPDIDGWVKGLTAARNGLAHGLRKSNQDVQQMYDLTRRTQLLLELIVMNEIGVPAEGQESYAIEHQITRW